MKCKCVSCKNFPKKNYNLRKMRDNLFNSSLIELQYLAEHAFNGEYKKRAEELAKIIKENRN